MSGDPFYKKMLDHYRGKKIGQIRKAETPDISRISPSKIPEDKMLSKTGGYTEKIDTKKIGKITDIDDWKLKKAPESVKIKAQKELAGKKLEFLFKTDPSKARAIAKKMDLEDILPASGFAKKAAKKAGKKIFKRIGGLASAAHSTGKALYDGEDIKDALLEGGIGAVEAFSPINREEAAAMKEIATGTAKDYKDFLRHSNEKYEMKEAEEDAKRSYLNSPAKQHSFRKLKGKLK